MDKKRVSQNLVPVKETEVLRSYGIYLSKKTLYRHHSEGIHPQIFVKLGNTLCIDLSEWEKLALAAKDRTKARCERLERLGVIETEQAA